MATESGSVLEGCYPVIFDGWKIHHTRSHGAWIRQGTVIFKNSQFSGQGSPHDFWFKTVRHGQWISRRTQKDCPRCFTYPTADCPGQHQTLQDSIFHGYTENIGNIHPDRGDFMKEKGEIKPVSSTTVQGGVEMYTYWYKAPDGIYRTQEGFQT